MTLDRYSEYPIRCSSCFESIASKVNDYITLQSVGLTKEQALLELDITCPISCIHFENPVHVPFNVQNRDVIEGRISVDMVDSKSPTPKGRKKKSIIPLPEASALTKLEALAIENLGGNMEIPTVSGLTTININNYPPEVISVGGGYTTTILPGRTFLCR